MKLEKEEIWMIMFVHPKKQVEAKGEVVIFLETVDKTNEKYKSKDLVQVLIGQTNALISSHKTDGYKNFFGVGKEIRG